MRTRSASISVVTCPVGLRWLRQERLNVRTFLRGIDIYERLITSLANTSTGSSSSTSS